MKLPHFEKFYPLYVNERAESLKSGKWSTEFKIITWTYRTISNFSTNYTKLPHEYLISVGFKIINFMS